MWNSTTITVHRRSRGVDMTLLMISMDKLFRLVARTLDEELRTVTKSDLYLTVGTRVKSRWGTEDDDPQKVESFADCIYWFYVQGNSESAAEWWCAIDCFYSRIIWLHAFYNKTAFQSKSDQTTHEQDTQTSFSAPVTLTLTDDLGIRTWSTYSCI